MRQLVRSWEEAPAAGQREAGIRSNVLNKHTRARTADVFRRVFLPRFINGPIPNAWKLVRPLEDAGASIRLLRPVYFWVTAKAEPLVRDFCADFLRPRRVLVQGGIRTAEVVSWLESVGCEWSPTVMVKVARGLLAALRDFGLLEGRAVKHLASAQLPVGAFAYLARCLTELGLVGRRLVNAPDWAIFLLETSDVEHLYLEAHQHRLLEYFAAGSTVSIEFPVPTLEKYAHVVVERAD